MNPTYSSRTPYENRGGQAQALSGGPCAVGSPPVTPRLVVLANDLDRLADELHSQLAALESGIERIGGGYAEIAPAGSKAQTEVASQAITNRLDHTHESLLLLRGRLDQAVKRLHSLA